MTKHTFCRELLKRTMKDVRKQAKQEIIKKAWGYKYSDDTVEFHINRCSELPEGFYWHGRGCCLWSAKSQGWSRFLEKKEEEKKAKKHSKVYELLDSSGKAAVDAQIAEMKEFDKKGMGEFIKKAEETGKMRSRHDYCRNFLKAIMQNVRRSTSKTTIKASWTYAYGDGTIEFHINKCSEAPEGFFWSSKNCCRWTARANGWIKYLEKKEKKEIKTRIKYDKPVYVHENPKEGDLVDVLGLEKPAVGKVVNLKKLAGEINCSRYVVAVAGKKILCEKTWDVIKHGESMRWIFFMTQLAGEKVA